MIIPYKKLNNGFKIPILGLGTYGMGGKIERDARNDDEKDIESICSAIDLGITHIGRIICSRIYGRNRWARDNKIR